MVEGSIEKSFYNQGVQEVLTQLTSFLDEDMERRLAAPVTVVAPAISWIIVTMVTP
jgi:hypothetical protein